MKEFKKIYDFMVAEIQGEYDKWVKSNWKLNSLYEALQQIHDVGDISSEPARKVLEEEKEREKEWNDRMRAEMNAHMSFLRKVEKEAKKYGLELNAVFETKRVLK